MRRIPRADGEDDEKDIEDAETGLHGYASSLQGTPEGANGNYHTYRRPKRGGEQGGWCSL